MREALRNPNFRRLFLGRLVTNAGDSIYMVAAMWLVYDLTGSPAYTGLAGFLVRAPQLLQALVGPLVDRWSLRRTLVGSELVQAALVLAIPAAWWFEALTVELVLVVMPLLSLLNQFVYPAQSAALPRIVEREHLVGANSAMSLAYQGTNLVFNALAGVLVALVGAVALYAIDSLTFVVAAVLFLAIRIPAAGGDAAADLGGEDAEAPEPGADDDPEAPSVTTPATPATPVADGGADESPFRAYLRELRDGFAYVRGTVLFALLIAGVVANATLGASFAVLPAFADLRGGPALYGALMAAIAGGGLVGALVASRVDDLPYGRLAIVGFTFSGGCWITAAFVPWPPATVALFALAFVPVGLTNVIIAAMVQTLTPDHLLGRVSAAARSMATAAAPLGALGGGLLAEQVGSVAVVALAGGGLVFIAVYTLALPSLRSMPPVGQMESLETA